MARRRKKEGLEDVLLVLPWWVSLALGGMAFATLRWIVPAMIASNPILVGVAAGTRALAWPALLFFGVFSVIVFAKEKAISAKERRAPRSIAEPKGFPNSASGASTVMLDRKVWGVLEQNSMAAPSAKIFNAWSVEALRALEWKRFELLCARYYEAVGFQSATLRCGADGGIDVKLFKLDPTKPLAIVQCKAWNAYSVGVKEVRELLGVMAHEKVGRGIFITTGTYTKDALAFGAGNPIQLLDGSGFMAKIQALSQDQQAALLKYAFDGDFMTPTCPSCGIKMKKRDGNRGSFWGCVGYPKCRSTFPLKI